MNRYRNTILASTVGIVAVLFCAAPRSAFAEAPMNAIPEGHHGNCAQCHGSQKPNTFTFDPARTTVTARFRGVGASLSASVAAVRGGFLFDVVNLDKSKITVELDTAAVRSADGLITDFLQSERFLDGNQFPIIRFVSTSIQKNTEDSYQISGQLTMHGMTTPVVLDARFDGGGPDPIYGAKFSSFHASGNFGCQQFGIRLCLSTDIIQLEIFALGRAPL